MRPLFRYLLPALFVAGCASTTDVTTRFTDEGSHPPQDTLLLVAHAARPPRLYAFDKSSGKEIMRKDLAASPSGSLMTYMVGQKQYISIPVGGRSGAGLLTLALPD